MNYILVKFNVFKKKIRNFDQKTGIQSEEEEENRVSLVKTGRLAALVQKWSNEHERRRENGATLRCSK